MFTECIDFINVLVAALLVGAMFGVWLMFNPAGMDPATYLVVQQWGIRTLNPVLPALGGLSILFTIVAAILGRHDEVRLRWLCLAVVCFIAAGLITRFRNQPINTVVIRWTLDSLPAKWKCFRAGWWLWHQVRLLAGLGGLVVLIATNLRR